METLLNANEDILIEPLSLTLAPTAKYIVDRRNAQFFSSVNSASYRGVQTVKFNLTGDVWADPESLLISFTVVNDGTAPLQASTVGAHCLFDKYECRMSATQIEHIEYFGRTTECFTRLISEQKRLNEGMLGFGKTNSAIASKGVTTDANPAAEYPVTGLPGEAGNHHAKSIAAGGRKRVHMRLPLSGIFSASQKYLPLFALGAGGCEILLSMAAPSEAVLSHDSAGAALSQDYHIEDLTLGIDLVTLASEVQNKYIEKLNEGAALMIHTKLWDIQQIYINPSATGNFDATMTKALSTLATGFVNFAPELDAAALQAGQRYANTFLMYPDAMETLQSSFSVGAKRFPEYATKGITAHFWRLVQALGVGKSLAHTVNAGDLDSYSTNSFVLGCDFEKCPLVSSTGMNVSGGQEIRLSVQGFKGAGAADVPRRAWVCLHSENVVEITSTGVTLVT